MLGDIFLQSYFIKGTRAFSVIYNINMLLDFYVQKKNECYAAHNCLTIHLGLAFSSSINANKLNEIA